MYQHFHPLGFDFSTSGSLKQNISFSSQLGRRVFKSSKKHSFAVGPSVVAVVSSYFLLLVLGVEVAWDFR